MKDYATCEDARGAFSGLLDGELDAEEKEGLERHLADCSECLRELDGLKKVSDVYESLPNVDAPEDLLDSIREEIQPERVDLSDSERRAQPIPFMPVLAAALVVALMALLSYSISNFLPSGEPEAPDLVDVPE